MSSSKRHFTAVEGSKEHGLFISSSPSSAARKIVSKLCASNKSKKVQFYVREITQGSKKKTYGPYLGEMKKLAKPIELKGRVIKYAPSVHLDKKKAVKKNGKKMKGGFSALGGVETRDFYCDEKSPNFVIKENKFGRPYIFFKKTKYYDDVYYYNFVIYIKKGLFSSKKELKLKYIYQSKIYKINNIFSYNDISRENFDALVSTMKDIGSSNTSPSVKEIINEFDSLYQQKKQSNKNYENKREKEKERQKAYEASLTPEEKKQIQKQKEKKFLDQGISQLQQKINNTKQRQSSNNRGYYTYQHLIETFEKNLNELKEKRRELNNPNNTS